MPLVVIPMLRILLFAALSLGSPTLLATSAPAPSHESALPLTANETNLLRTEVVDEDEVSQPLVFKGGKLVAQLEEGQGYGLKLTNLTDRRIMVVVSVDSIDPMRGTKSYQGQPGVVLEPNQSRVLMKGKPSKRAPAQPLLPLNPSRATIALMTFQEATDYPTQGTGLPPAPFGPENYRVNEKGEREWVPPKGYPFRKNPRLGHEVVQFYYEIVEDSVSSSSEMLSVK